MDDAVKTKYIDLIKEIDIGIDKLKNEINSTDQHKKSLYDRLKVLEAQKEELKSHIN